MRYFWLFVLSVIIAIGATFVYQNQTPVSVKFSVDWVNVSIGFSRVPVFIPILVALVFGILLTAFYLFGT